MHRLALLPFSWVLGLLAGPVHAQALADGSDPTTPRAAPAPSVFRNVGLHPRDGGLVGGGPAYTVTFVRDRVEFVPGFGTAVPALRPVVWRAVSAGREGALQPLAPASPVQDGMTARYRRGAVEELYEVRLDGLKQSFLFHERPAGAGDLVVRLALETDLVPAVESGRGDLRLAHDADTAVTIREVIGIDGAGARMAGTMRLDAGVLELRLPAAFVDTAALPLVLDPVVGVEVGVRPGTSFDDDDPDIAYDATNDVYCVAWEYRSSSNGGEIRAQRVQPDGTLVGGTIFVSSTSANEINPKIANVNSEDAFVVVWQVSNPFGPDQVDARAVAAASGALGSSVTVADGSRNAISPDVGGEATTVDNDAIVVWKSVSTDEIQARQVAVVGTTLTPFVATQVMAGDDPPGGSVQFTPAISKSGGTTGHHVIVFSRSYTGDPKSKIRGVMVNRNLGILASELFPSASQGTDHDEDDPDVDGDGRNWVVAWERSEDTAGISTKDDVVCRALRWDPGAPVGQQGYSSGPVTVVEAGINDDEQDVAVAWAGGSALIGYEDELGARYDVDLFSADPLQCVPCESLLSPVFSGSRDEQDIALASAFSGTADPDTPHAFIAIASTDTTTGDGDILGRPYTVSDGRSTELASGCGTQGGTTLVPCARVANSNFEIALRAAAASTPTAMILGAEQANFACSLSCTLVPNPFSNAFVFGLSTDARGDAEVGFAIPFNTSLAGVKAIVQWTTFAGPDICSHLSNAVEFEVQ